MTTLKAAAAGTAPAEKWYWERYFPCLPFFFQTMKEKKTVYVLAIARISKHEWITRFSQCILWRTGAKIPFLMMRNSRTVYLSDDLFLTCLALLTEAFVGL